MTEFPTPYTVEMKIAEAKVFELTLHMPQPLLETLARMIQSHHGSLEPLVVRLTAHHGTVVCIDGQDVLCACGHSWSEHPLQGGCASCGCLWFETEADVHRSL